MDNAPFRPDACVGYELRLWFQTKATAEAMATA
jgi:hypothetical protein